MRFYDSPSIERIGFDFYCDIANNIVKLREENGFTQKDLAVKTGIKEYRISNMENVKIRIDLDGRYFHAGETQGTEKCKWRSTVQTGSAGNNTVRVGWIADEFPE